MINSLLSTAAVTFIKELSNDSNSMFKEILEEGKYQFGNIIEVYINKQLAKYSHIKTLLRGNTPVYLYDIYYHIGIYNNSHKVNTKNIKSIFRKSNCVTVIGDAGSGKSTLIKHLNLNCILDKYAIPVLIELRYLNSTNDSIIDYIYKEIFENKLTKSERILEKILDSGQFVFFLDGYDELISDKKQKVIDDINKFAGIFKRNKFVLTTRPYSNIEQLPNFVNYKMCKLNESTGDISEFIDLQLKGEEELAEKIKASLKESRSKYIESFLSNPLLLSLYILTFQSNATVPDKKYIFYRRVINALFSEHDSKTKLGFVREKLSGLNQEGFEEILRAFSLLSFFENKLDFDHDYIDCKLREIKTRIKHLKFDNIKFVNDMKSAIALWVEDNGEYSFAHRSLQEYFTAQFIKNLNLRDKKKLYEKIIDRFSKIRLLNEVENFLSLCQEMDNVYFNKFYCLPLLKEMKRELDASSNEALTISYIKMLCTTVKLPSEGNEHNHINLNDGLYRTIYIHLDHTRKLYHELKRFDFKSEVLKCSNSNSKSLNFNKPLSKSISECLMKSKMPLLALNFSNYINKSIAESEKIIKESIATDHEFVELI